MKGRGHGMIRVRLGQNRLARVKAAATQADLTVNEWIRMAVDQVLGLPTGWNRDEDRLLPEPVRPEPIHPRRAAAGFVYLIRHCVDGRLVKIGYSAAPARRQKEIENAEGCDLQLLAIIPSPDMRMLEARLHEKYSFYHVRGEWFSLDDEQVGEILRMSEPES